MAWQRARPILLQRSPASELRGSPPEPLIAAISLADFPARYGFLRVEHAVRSGSIVVLEAGCADAGIEIDWIDPAFKNGSRRDTRICMVLAMLPKRRKAGQASDIKLRSVRKYGAGSC